MVIDLEKIFNNKIIYAILDPVNKVAYIGRTEQSLLNRIGQHLDKNKYLKNHIQKVKPKQLEIKVLFEYKRNHKNIKTLLDNKESYFMKKYHNLGYTLLNKSKMAKLDLK